MLSQEISIESKLEENVHLRGLLTVDQSAVVHDTQLIKSKESHVRKDLVQCEVVSIKA